MALLFMDSFDHYATADVLEKWSSQSVVVGSLAINATGGRRSSGSWRWTTGSNSANVNVGSLVRTLVPAPADATFVIGFALRVSGPPGAAGFSVLSLQDGVVGVQITLRLNSDYSLSVMRGNQTAATVLGSTAAGMLVPNIHAYLELKVLIANAGGTVDLQVNGVNVLSLTAQDTQATANALWNTVVLGHYFGVTNATTTTSQTVDFDDLYVLDGTGAAPWNTFLGDCRVDARYPTAPGAAAAWTPLAGANWAAVDDPGTPYTAGVGPDDDTTYTSTSTVAATDTFVYQDAPVVGAAIYGIQHCLNLKKMDAGTCTVSPVVRHGTTNYPGTATAPSTGYAYALAVQQTNPGTSAQWTEAGFNAAEFGYTRVS